MKATEVLFAIMLGIALGAAGHGSFAAERADQVNRQLLTENLAGCQSKQLSVAVLESPPGSIGFHYHPGETFTYLLDGKLTHELRGQNLSTLGSGDFVHDDNGQVHRTDYLTPVKLLIIRVLDQGQPETTRVE